MFAQQTENPNQEEKQSLSLITETAEEGFEVAIQLARKGVTSTQPDKDVLFMLRDVYSKDPDALIASSQVIAIHFQTVAAANNYWRQENEDQ
ncbi:hexameric tyrosine-coordinated heme protein [Rhodohalobacter halophilus]|uniref:hexameric tyrosine-coordinated heme protein n=1 Tax=Rhodohalobacter halophilus TaxID=1812810 RepID=UPI00083F6BD5